MTYFDEFELNPLPVNKDRILVTRWERILFRVCFETRGKYQRRPSIPKAELGV